MYQKEIIKKTADFVKKTLENAEGGHDWWHIYRVWQTAKTIAQAEVGLEMSDFGSVSEIRNLQSDLENTEGSSDFRGLILRVGTAADIQNPQSDIKKPNLLVVELAALLHDIADAKFHNGDEEIGPKTARNFLNSLEIDTKTIEHVENIIRHISFKGGNFEKTFHSLELAIVQDADRLDAIGAIGIARTFNYGGFKNRPLHDPSVKPNLDMSKEAYKNSQAPTINHFYEKLLLLKDRMNTEAGKRMAAQRHEFMEAFLAQFYAEWEGIS